jgi:hypothetical protein
MLFTVAMEEYNVLRQGDPLQGQAAVVMVLVNL